MKLEENFRQSGIDPRTISYVEAAANGSPLGDPIKLTALNKAFQIFTADQGFCAIGSVKSNIGHAEAASGISQLTKVILQLQHQQLVPSTNAQSLNPNLSFEGSPFRLQQSLQAWPRPVIRMDGREREFPRRATVSAFGAGGANARLIVEEYQAEANAVSAGTDTLVSDSRMSALTVSSTGEAVDHEGFAQREIMVFSAKSRDSLHAVLQQMSVFVDANPSLSLANIAYTLQVGRMAMSHRVILLVNNRRELSEGIKEALRCLSQNTTANTTIPLYMGDVESGRSEVADLFSGKSGEAMMKVILAENNLEKMALYWVKGGKIPWMSFANKAQATMIALPLYPFTKRRCWLEVQPETPVVNAHQSIENTVTDIMRANLGLSRQEFNLNRPLVDYGVDSIMFMRIFQQIKAEVEVDVNLRSLLECNTVQDMLTYLTSPKEKEAVQADAVPAETPEQRLSSVGGVFSELVHLNSTTEGRPVCL